MAEVPLALPDVEDLSTMFGKELPHHVNGHLLRLAANEDGLTTWGAFPYWGSTLIYRDERKLIIISTITRKLLHASLQQSTRYYPLQLHVFTGKMKLSLIWDLYALFGLGHNTYLSIYPLLIKIQVVKCFINNSYRTCKLLRNKPASEV